MTRMLLLLLLLLQKGKRDGSTYKQPSSLQSSNNPLLFQLLFSARTSQQQLSAQVATTIDSVAIGSETQTKAAGTASYQRFQEMTAKHNMTNTSKKTLSSGDLEWNWR